MSFCEILRHFDREQDSGYCYIGPGGGEVNDDDYPSIEELIEYRDWYLENPIDILKKED